jgi:hypothetical protein
MRKHHVMFGLAIVVVTGLWLILLRNSQEPAVEPKSTGGYGSPEEAFNAAKAALKDYISSIDGEPIRIDPPFRANLHSQSKLWTIKGYASCPKNNKKWFRWTVILNYNDLQEWEVLAKIVTPEFTKPDTNQIDGYTHVEGTLFPPDTGR